MQSAREKAQQGASRSPRYGFEYGQIMLMYLIGLAFCVISPLVLPFTLAYFMGAWLFWRYQMLYVLVRKYESGERQGHFVGLTGPNNATATSHRVNWAKKRNRGIT